MDQGWLELVILFKKLIVLFTELAVLFAELIVLFTQLSDHFLLQVWVVTAVTFLASDTSYLNSIKMQIKFSQLAALRPKRKITCKYHARIDPLPPFSSSFLKVENLERTQVRDRECLNYSMVLAGSIV